jgi:hypothetical protein
MRPAFVSNRIGYRVIHPGLRNTMQALAVAGGIAMTGR